MTEYVKVPAQYFQLRWRCIHRAPAQCDPSMHDAMVSHMPPAHRNCGWVHRADLTPETFKDLERS